MVSDLKGVSWRQEGRHSLWGRALVGAAFPRFPHPRPTPRILWGLISTQGANPGSLSNWDVSGSSFGRSTLGKCWWIVSSILSFHRWEGSGLEGGGSHTLEPQVEAGRSRPPDALLAVQPPPSAQALLSALSLRTSAPSRARTAPSGSSLPAVDSWIPSHRCILTAPVVNALPSCSPLS